MAFRVDPNSGIALPTGALRGSPVESETDVRYGGTGLRTERNPKLGIPGRYRTFADMERWIPPVAAFQTLLRLSVNQVKVSFGTENDARPRALLGVLLEPEAIAAISRSEITGMSVVEFAFDEDGNISAWQEIPPQTIVEFITGENSEMLGFVQQTETGRHYIPAWNTVYSTTGRGPRGEGLYLGIANTAIRFLENENASHLAAQDNAKRHPNVFVDRQTATGKTGEELRKLVDQRNFNPSNRFLLSSELYEVEAQDGTDQLVSGARKHILDYPTELKLGEIDRTEKLMLRLSLMLGMEAFVLGQSREGSKALAEVQARNFDAILRGVMSKYEASTQDLIERIYAIRGYRNVPTVTVDTEVLPDPQMQADVLMKLMQAGIPLDSPQGKRILESLLLPTEVMEQEPVNENEGENDGDGDD